MVNSLKAKDIYNIPLCVDLDGTLVKTDMLLETLILLLKSNPLYIFLLPFWLFKGKAYMKHQVARRVKIDMPSLPFHKNFLSFLREQHESGRILVLATASDSIIAEQVAEHLGFFNDVLSSNTRVNLKGKKKLQVLLKKYGDHGFDYAANSHVDVPVREHCNKAILVNVNDGLVDKVKSIAKIHRIFKE